MYICTLPLTEHHDPAISLIDLQTKLLSYCVQKSLKFQDWQKNCIKIYHTIFPISRRVSSGRLYPRCFLKMYKRNARKRTRAFLMHTCVFLILAHDTSLLRRFLPAIVARHLLVFSEFYMPEKVSHAVAQSHLHE